MALRAIFLAAVAGLLAFSSCSPGGPAGPAVRPDAPITEYSSQQIRRDLTGKQRPEVERLLGVPDSVTGSPDSSGAYYYKTFEKQRRWAAVDSRTQTPCHIVIVRFEKGAVQEVEFRCW